MQGTDLSVQVMGQIKLRLLLLCRPLWVAILCMGGHQTWQCIQINLLVLCMHAVALGVQVISGLEPWVNMVRNCRTLFCMAGNFLWVATQLGYTLG